MKISLNVYKFRTEFITPFNTGKNIINNKDSMLLRLTEDNGCCGVSEVSLFPGFTQNDISSVTEDFKKLKYHFDTNNFPEKISDIFLYTKKISSELNLSTQIGFALDSALLMIYEKTELKPAYNLLNYFERDYSASPRVKINTLIIPDEDTKKTLTLLEKAVLSGFETVKIKMGRMKLKKENRLIRLISEEFKGRLRIRTDSNMKMSFIDALELFRGIDPETIEYAEDPFPDLEKIPLFFSETGIKTGIDLADKKIDLNKILSENGIGSIVIKPALIGGIHDIKNVFNICRDNDIPLIFSSLFETATGIINIAKISTLFDFKSSAMGLDTLKYLKKSPLTDHNLISKGFLYPFDRDSIEIPEKIFRQNSFERVI